MVYLDLQVGKSDRFFLRPQGRREGPVCFDHGVGDLTRVKDVFAAQRLHQIGGGQAQHPQSILVDLSIQNDCFGPAG